MKKKYVIRYVDKQRNVKEFSVETKSERTARTICKRVSHPKEILDVKSYAL